MFLRLSKTQNRIATKIIALTLIVFMIAAVITTTVQAGTTCGGMHDTGTCCDSWWPGLQKWYENHCANCSASGCIYYTNYDCKDISSC